jgi:hypothetical protein
MHELEEKLERMSPQDYMKKLNRWLRELVAAGWFAGVCRRGVRRRQRRGDSVIRR